MPDTKVKLLIVDDEPVLLESLSQIFVTIGHSVRSAVDGFSALSKIEQEIPDIILSDLNMPGMSGFELLCVVRRRFPAIRIIAMSGAFTGSDVPIGVAADAFYPKGTSLAKLLQAVEAMAHMQQTPERQPRPSHDLSGRLLLLPVPQPHLRIFPEAAGSSSLLSAGGAKAKTSLRWARA